MPTPPLETGRQVLPAGPGIGLKTEHIAPLLAQRPQLSFVEVHAENYFVDGGARLANLEKVREHYPLSIHGVAASLGGAEPLDPLHLQHLKRLIERFDPQCFSEHLAWATYQGIYHNDLLPLPYSQASLQRVCEHVDQLQSVLGRRILVENPASYLRFSDAEISEPEFISELILRTGCGLLLDLNNLHVSCCNHDLDRQHYLEALPLHAVGEIHLAGYAPDQLDNGQRLLIDSHDRDVSAEVWQLYAQVCAQLGAKPTLLERDANLPPFEELVAEALLANTYLQQHCSAGPEHVC